MTDQPNQHKVAVGSVAFGAAQASAISFVASRSDGDTIDPAMRVTLSFHPAGFVFLAVVLGLFSRKVVSRNTAD